MRALFVSSPASEASVGGGVIGRFGPMTEGVGVLSTQSHPAAARAATASAISSRAAR